jgi:hypothetical protein
MAQLILEEVHIDIDAKEVLYVKPRAAMLPLFELVRDEKVWPGDPERAVSGSHGHTIPRADIGS